MSSCTHRILKTSADDGVKQFFNFKLVFCRFTPGYSDFILWIGFSTQNNKNSTKFSDSFQNVWIMSSIHNCENIGFEFGLHVR